MTGTRLASVRVLGSAWPRHFSKPIAEAAYENIKRVGLPAWSDADQTLARALQRELGVPDSGLASRLDTLGPPPPMADRRGGGSDDIGDVSWTLPTITLRFPSNIPRLPGHNWANAIAMATPIAHKGATAGAKVLAMTMIDVLLKPELRTQAWTYFRDVQTKTMKYQPLMRPDDKPAVELNTGIMERYRPALRRFYYDATKHKSYLEQLGVAYPTVRRADGVCPVPSPSATSAR
jgi:aminobenzoyl-glutamate utilization protein B